jgi:hypothetical protein
MLDSWKSTRQNLLKFNLIPYIQISISKNWDRFEVSPWLATKYLNELLNSEEYKEIIEVASLRLEDLGYYIQKEHIENKHLNILIYRKTDQNYIK